MWQRQDGEPPTYEDLGVPVARWVEDNVVDPLTDGRHRILSDAARIMNGLALASSPPSTKAPSTPVATHVTLDAASIASQVDLSLHTYPAAERALATLRTVSTAPVDLTSLIHSPQELFKVEDMWAGKLYAERKRQEEMAMEEMLVDDPAKYLEWAIKEHREASATSAEESAKAKVADVPEMLAFALEHAAETIARILKGEGEDEKGGERDEADESKVELDEDAEMKTEDKDLSMSSADTPPDNAKATLQQEDEDEGLRNLRWNLLALAKRLPLDQITKLPPELIPVHLRHILPTADKA